MTTILLEVASNANLTNPEGGDNPFLMGEAVVFAFTLNGFRILARDGDVYDALEMVTDNHLKLGELGIGVLTTGWASPLGADGEIGGAPSEHPLRRRVRLVTCVDKAKRMASSMRFADDPDEMLTDEGSATGSLATALVTAVGFLVAREN
jgi:hypothetical protein